MSRTNHIGVYVSDTDQSRLKREAEEAGMSVSGYVMSIIQEKWNTEDTEETAQQARVEERVERMTLQATDKMAARSAVYSIAKFDLLKLTQNPPEAARTKSL